MSRPGYLNLPVTETMNAQLTAICSQLGLDPDSRGAFVRAVQFAVQQTVYQEGTMKRAAEDLYPTIMVLIPAERKGMNSGTIIEDEYGHQLRHLPASMDDAEDWVREQYPQATIRKSR